jgi:ArsR family transcriptional regulator
MSDGGEVQPAGCGRGALDATTLTVGQAAALAMLFKALADPSRIRIVNRLLNTTTTSTVEDLTEELGLAQSTVSYHLKRLTLSGLLHRQQVGVWARYTINHDALRWLSAAVHVDKE